MKRSAIEPDKLEMSGKDTLPEPKPEKAGRSGALFWACLALLVIGGAVWWLLQPDESRKNLREAAAEQINKHLADTPFAGMGNVLREAPPKPPQNVINPPTDPGTLSGRSISGTLASDVDLSGPAGEGGAILQGAQSGDATVAPLVGAGEELQPVLEDKQVPPAYLEALAVWLADRYQPASGRLGISAQTLNLYGATTLASRAKGGRSGLLRYAFQPSMLNGLYKLYIDRFMADLNGAAQKRGLTEEQNRQFHMALAGKAVLWAAGLEGVLALPNLKASMDKIDGLAQKAVDLNIQVTNTVFELDELREAKASRQQLDTVQMRVDGLVARYRRAMEEHSAAQRGLVEEIRKKAGQNLDGETLLFMASWVERRLAEDGGGTAALQNCVSLLRDLGRRLASAEPNV